MVDRLAKEKRAERARVRREEMRRHIEFMRGKQQHQEEEENRPILKALQPLIRITRTEEFRRWYQNRRNIPWREEIEKNPFDIIINLGMAGFPMVSEIDLDIDGHATALVALMRAKVKECEASWTLRLKRQRQATPPWFDAGKLRALEARREAMNQVFPEAGPWHIDHIIPLAGEIVCGLHVHTNMRIIPQFLNCSKNNEFDETLLDVKSTIV